MNLLTCSAGIDPAHAIEVGVAALLFRA